VSGGRLRVKDLDFIEEKQDKKIRWVARRFCVFGREKSFNCRFVK
jgi:hypothetical protein